MQFIKFAEHINKLLKERPETAYLEVVSAQDPEGNGFESVLYPPSVGFYDEDEKDFIKEVKLNSVCIN